MKRARAFAMEKRVTLIHAPAGSGKSTLMAQLASDGADATIVWLSLDEDDSDANRLFTSLLATLQGVRLEWEVDPLVIASQVNGSREHSRAAVNLLINALCSFDGERLLVVLDDLHRVCDASALELLDYLIERLPPEAGFVIGTRVAPALALARWRTRGELGELRMTDLQFDEHDAQVLADMRFSGAASPRFVRNALERTHGWVAGLQLVFGAGQQPEPGAVGVADRHTFDFLAHEVVADLPRELREFAIRCSILPELSPTLCAAVAGAADVRPFLEELYRRHLFLSVIDDVTPVLRFHDLFREFLQRELERLVTGQELRELHARAARAESAPTRAISHWLKAAMWDVAVEAIESCAEPLLAEGGQALVERWIGQLPATHRQDRPGVLRLLALCAWARYDTPGVRQLMERACNLYRERRDHRGLARTLPIVARMCNSTGDLDTCDRLVQECEKLELEPADRATISAVRVWNAMACGRGSEAVRSLQELVDAARQNSTVLYPAVCDFFNSFFYDVPGALAPMRALKALCAYAEQMRPIHWQVSAQAHSAWPEFCVGDYSAAIEAFADREKFQQRHATLPATWLDINQLRAVHLAASGRHAEGLEQLEKSIEFLRGSELAELRESWLRPVMLDATRFAWAAENAPALRKLLAPFEAPRVPAEWPALESGAALARGQCALLEGRLDVAEHQLIEACRLHDRWPHVMFMRQPRVALAFLRIAQGDSRAAWTTFAPVWQRALDEDAVGMLLLEPPARLGELLSSMPDSLRQQPATRALLDRLATWKQAPDKARERAREVASSLAVLTEREREVVARIAAGDSNKLIARSLDLSLHTVKRHVANILGKLNVPTRSAAASIYRGS
ncbi:MAG TPA: LuxR C-terminal-related transcriptional regulator [Steroidobacteraceae bacterium]|nr:LuxR C-terminal-related transcriptional regulator [Steroidobacteraceae bacterium]